MNEMCGMLGMLSQLIADSPTGFKLSHSFKKGKCVERNISPIMQKDKLVINLLRKKVEDIWENNLVHIFKYFDFGLVLSEKSLDPYSSHLTGHTLEILTNCQFLSTLH